MTSASPAQAERPTKGGRLLLRRARTRLGVMLFGALLAAGSYAAMLLQPMIVGVVLDRVMGQMSVGNLVWILVVVFIGGLLCQAASTFLLGRAGESIVRDLRVAVGTRLLRMRVPDHERHRAGDLLSRVGADTSMLRTVLTSGPVNALVGMVAFVSALVLMALVDLVLFAATLLVVGVSLAIILAVLPQVRKSATVAQKGLGDLIAVLDRALRGIRMIKASRAEEREGRSVADNAEVAYRGGSRVIGVQALVTPINARAPCWPSSSASTSPRADT